MFFLKSVHFWSVSQFNSLSSARFKLWLVGVRLISIYILQTVSVKTGR